MEAPGRPGKPLWSANESRGSRWLSSATVALLVVLASGGAATHPSGVLVGLPSAASLCFAVLAGSLVWVSGAAGLGGFLLPASAVLLGALAPQFGPGLFLFTGRPLFSFVLAALFVGILARGLRPPRALLLPFFLVVYSGVSYRAQIQVGPDGDEPQYLMVAESLVRDHDLALDQDFKQKRYTAFFSRPLEPHFRIRGPQGQIYSLHAVGLPVLILPAYWLLGYPGASFFMALLAALLVRELRRLLMAVSADSDLAEGTAWLVGLSPPMIHFAGLIFTEIPAALLLCVGLRTACFGRTPGALRMAAVCASALPWFNVRYSILSLAIAISVALRLWNARRIESQDPLRARALLSPVLILLGSALAIGLYHFQLWGFFDPRRVYGRSREFSLDILPEGLPGLFFDQEFGLFVYAPIFVLSLPGLKHLFRHQRPLAVAGLFALMGVVATASVWPMWRGGFNPPARFLVPLISILAVGLSLSLQRGVRPATALLAGWSLWCGLAGALNLETVHRDRDGLAPFFRTQAGAQEWTAALPSFVLPEDRTTRGLAWPWAVLLALPAVFAMRPPRRESWRPTHRGVLGSAAALMATAMLADRLSPRIRSPERAAARLLGSPVLLLPSFEFQGASEAAWRLDLFYEPHRNPEGLPFAQAIHFEAPRYALTLFLRDGETAGSPPSLVIRPRRGGHTVSVPMTSRTEGLFATFEPGAPGDYDLWLKGGEPLATRRVRLVVGY